MKRSMFCFALTVLVLGPAGRGIAAPARPPREAGPSPAASAAASPAPSASPHGPMDALAWRNIGPAIAGGRLAAVAGSDADPALAYIGTAGGGVWKSGDGTTSWQPVFDKQHVGSIGAIAVSSRDPSDVWVGTGESNPRNDVSFGDGVYRSRDGGKTWAHLGLAGSYAISKISLDPRDPNIAVVAALGDPFRDSSERGIYRTADGGATWTQTLSLSRSSGAADLDRSAKAPNVLYAAMWHFRRSSWHLESGGDDDGLFKSSDGGATWARVSGGGFAEGTTGRIGIAVAPSDPRRVYALVESARGILWRSEDGGAHWTMTSANTLIDERPFYYTRIFVDPQDEDHLFATSVRLAESRNGGKTWQLSGKHLHGDHHAVWFSADGKRILEANDGGPALSRDGGKTWEWRNNVPIAQAYRVAVDGRVPYDVCTGLQDNGSWCGPSDGGSDAGILGSDWLRVGGGDGNWTVPDPLDPAWIWASAGGGDNGGELMRYNVGTRLVVDVSPYLRNQNVVAPAELAYRFNWEAPLAFSPFDGRTAYYGGNVLFRSRDGGRHWTPISPDLTRNIKARQTLSGTPLRLDVTGAETYDTILCIAPSRAARDEIWVATDDGRIALTRDGGAHWRDASVPGLDADARVPTLVASARDPATAYATVDRHFTGDRAPYVYATSDYGRTWRPIDAGLPRGEMARGIVEDPRAPSVLFVGLENSVWWSNDRGTRWRSLQQNLPPTSVRDLQIQSGAGDLVAGTHGRGLWILDDIAPLEEFAHAQTAGTMLFAPRAAFAFEQSTPTVNPIAPGENLAARSLITFYLTRPAKASPTLDILDGAGRSVRHLAGTHTVDGEPVPAVGNVAGFNRVGWDLTGDPPVAWERAPDWNRGPDNGADVLPGNYTVVLHVDGRNYRAPLSVRPDPRIVLTAGERRAHVAYIAGLYDRLSRIDVALNALDNVQLQLPERIASLQGRPQSAAALDAARGVLAEANREASELSSHPVNGQDNDFLPDLLRERLQSLLAISSALSPTAEQTREARSLQRELDPALARNATFLRDRLPALQRALHDSGLLPLDLAAKPPAVKADPSADEHGVRRESQ